MFKSLFFTLLLTLCPETKASQTEQIVFHGNLTEHQFSGSNALNSGDTSRSCVLTLRLFPARGEGIEVTRSNRGSSWTLLRPTLTYAQIEIPSKIEGEIVYRPPRRSQTLSAIYMYEGRKELYTAMVSHTSAPFNLTFDFSSQQDSATYPIAPLDLFLSIDEHDFTCSNFVRQ